MPYESRQLPDGSFQVYYIPEKTSQTIRTFYIKRVVCPKCGRRGGLNAVYSRPDATQRWWGPYFQVIHTTTRCDKETYRELRSKGMGSKLAGERSMMIKNTSHCYFGKHCPVPVEKIPEPEG